ncbi:MAG TPA: hypothetical protein VGN13_09185 [Solirubrobacteraceae bacterium]
MPNLKEDQVHTHRRSLATRSILVACLAMLLMLVAAPAEGRSERASSTARRAPTRSVHHRSAHRRGARRRTVSAHHRSRNGRHARGRRSHNAHRRHRLRCPLGSSLHHHRHNYFCHANSHSARSAQTAPSPPLPAAPAAQPALVGNLSAGAPGVVSSAPAGPASPAGGWHVAFADGFTAAIGAGAGQDGFWKANTNTNGCCNNGDEIASESPSQVHVGADGLELLCTASGGYVCGGVDTTTAFNWRPGGGQTWAFEVLAKLPPRDGGEDPGWWSTDTKWTNEVDYFEGWEWGHEEYFAGMPVWKSKTPSAVEVSHEAYKLKSEIGNPEESFHRYTTVIKANNEMEEFIDGQYRWSVPAPSSMNAASMHLILTHALRVSTHLTGSSSFDIRSVAVYEDAAQAGQNVEGGGVAPGTVLG